VARAKVEGLQKLRQRTAELARIADKESRGRAAQLATNALNETAAFTRDAIRSSASAGGWPSRLMKTIFAFGDTAADSLPRTLRASLVGIRKGAPPRLDRNIYREWRASSTNTSPRKKRGGGTLMGMSLAAMYEFGTSKIQGRPAFRPTVTRLRSTIRQRLITSYKAIIEDLGK
jgi:hypothetical protein